MLIFTYFFMFLIIQTIFSSLINFSFLSHYLISHQAIQTDYYKKISSLFLLTHWPAVSHLAKPTNPVATGKARWMGPPTIFFSFLN